jgi:hypothetical protein
MPKFEAVPWRQTVKESLEKNEMSCLNCHGLAHPTRATRTPGSPDYAPLDEGRTMRHLRWEAWATAVALMIALV